MIRLPYDFFTCLKPAGSTTFYFHHFSISSQIEVFKSKLIYDEALAGYSIIFSQTKFLYENKLNQPIKTKLV